MQVNDLMNRSLAIVRAIDTLRYAVQLMERFDCGCVPVVDADGRVAGMLTDRDVCLAALRSDRPLSEMTCGWAMSAPAHVCRAEDTIGQAERLMALHRVRRLPVVDADGRLAGLVSLDDLSREASRQADLQMHSLSQHEVGWTLGEITRRRSLAYLPPALDGPGT